MDAGPVVTIADITQGIVPPGTAISLSGAVVMSKQFLLSKSAGGTCSWGVFLSAPGLTETAANSGILAITYGADAAPLVDGGAPFCPVPTVQPIGDAFPDDIAPGDVVDLQGVVATFLSPSCATTDGGTTVPTFELTSIAAVKKTGTAAVPAPHALTATERTSFVSQTDSTFLSAWGNVKVRQANVQATPQAGPSIQDAFGAMHVGTPTVGVSDKIFYQGQLKSSNVCREAFDYANTSTTFTTIDGFVSLDFCTWSQDPANRCIDLVPGSDDCGSSTCP